MKSPILLHNVPNPVNLEDFPKNSVCAARQIYYAISIISNQKSTEITPDDVVSVLLPSKDLYAIFHALNGEEFLESAYSCGNPETSNFNFYYSQLKRNSLLRELKLKGYDISKYDIDEASETLSNERYQIQDNYNNATEEEILGYVEQQFNFIKTKFSGGSLGSSDAADGIFELLESLGTNGDYGLPLCGDMLSSIVRGKRLGCMYLRSAGTGGSKTRSSVFDACEAVYPITWRMSRDSRTHTLDGGGYWVYNPAIVPQRTLFVMTEQTPNEIRLMMLAYISGIEERRIKSNLLTESEKQRVHFAAQEMAYFKGYFKFEEINDPNLHNVSNVIKKHIIQNDVKYIYYDYIFASPSLLSELNKNLRTDQALMLLSNQLKELAKTYNVFIMTSTQLNGEGLTSGRKRDQSMLSNAKSIAD